MAPVRQPDPRSADFAPPGAPARVAAPGERLALRIPGRGYVTTALTCASITLVFPPAIVFAIGFALAGKRRGDPWAQPAIVASMLCFVFGIAVAAVADGLDPDSFAFITMGLLAS